MMFCYTKKCASSFLRDSFSTKSLRIFDSILLQEVKVIESVNDNHIILNINTYTVEEQVIIYPTVVINSVRTLSSPALRVRNKVFRESANKIIDME